MAPSCRRAGSSSPTTRTSPPTKDKDKDKNKDKDKTLQPSRVLFARVCLFVEHSLTSSGSCIVSRMTYATMSERINCRITTGA
mmetsp:Transcript_117692/g.340261  ORF Transcript_117692/g.340261 Transcript_117692/m.340261 type:complete len:83 (-) Transcript_117692:441-689(-)